MKNLLTPVDTHERLKYNPNMESVIDRNLLPSIVGGSAHINDQPQGHQNMKTNHLLGISALIVSLIALGTTSLKAARSFDCLANKLGGFDLATDALRVGMAKEDLQKMLHLLNEVRQSTNAAPQKKSIEGMQKLLDVFNRGSK